MSFKQKIILCPKILCQINLGIELKDLNNNQNLRNHRQVFSVILPIFFSHIHMTIFLIFSKIL